MDAIANDEHEKEEARHGRQQNGSSPSGSFWSLPPPEPEPPQPLSTSKPASSFSSKQSSSKRKWLSSSSPSSPSSSCHEKNQPSLKQSRKSRSAGTTKHPPSPPPTEKAAAAAEAAASSAADAPAEFMRTETGRLKIGSYEWWELHNDDKDLVIKIFHDQYDDKQQTSTTTAIRMDDDTRSDHGLYNDPPVSSWWNNMISTRLRNDEDVAKVAMETKIVRSFGDLPRHFGDNKNIVMTAWSLYLDIDPEIHVSARLLDDLEVVRLAVCDDPMNLKHASPRFRDDAPVVSYATVGTVRGTVDALQFASSRLRDDYIFMVHTVSNLSSKECVACWGEGPLKWASKRLQGNKQFVLYTLSELKNGRWLEHASETLKNDYDVVTIALRYSSLALEFVSDELKSNKTIVLRAVEKCGTALRFASNVLKMDGEICKAAVAQDVYALIYVGKSLLEDRQFALQAVKMHANALAYFPKVLRNDVDICIEALGANDNARRYIPDRFQNDRTFILKVVSKNGSRIDIFPPFKRDLEIVHAAVANSRGVALESVDHSYRNDIDAILLALNGETVTEYEEPVTMASLRPIFQRLLRINDQLKERGDPCLFLLNRSNLFKCAMMVPQQQQQSFEDAISVKIWIRSHYERIWLCRYFSSFDDWCGVSGVHTRIMDYAGYDQGRFVHLRNELQACEQVINRMINLGWKLPNHLPST